MVYCIGLTGNIACGKSTAANYFAKLGVSVINADEIAKELTACNQPAFHDIITHFGDSILTASGEINRRYLRQLVFSDVEERLWLERLLHPLIRNHIEHRIGNVKTPYCLIEIPLLYDKSNYPYLNRILLIDADLEQQIARFMTRDKDSRETALAILATQANATERHPLADDILKNTGSLADLQNNVAALHEKYLQYALSQTQQG